MHISRSILVFCAVLVSATAFATDLNISKAKCSQSGDKFAIQFKREFSSELSIFGNPEFHYSKVLDMCVVFTEIIDGTFDTCIETLCDYRRVTDVYSNNVLS
jgi:hypothetical protein